MLEQLRPPQVVLPGSGGLTSAQRLSGHSALAHVRPAVASKNVRAHQRCQQEALYGSATPRAQGAIDVELREARALAGSRGSARVFQTARRSSADRVPL